MDLNDMLKQHYTEMKLSAGVIIMVMFFALSVFRDQMNHPNYTSDQITYAKQYDKIAKSCAAIQKLPEHKNFNCAQVMATMEKPAYTTPPVSLMTKILLGLFALYMFIYGVYMWRKHMPKDPYRFKTI